MIFTPPCDLAGFPTECVRDTLVIKLHQHRFTQLPIASVTAHPYAQCFQSTCFTCRSYKVALSVVGSCQAAVLSISCNLLPSLIAPRSHFSLLHSARNHHAYIAVAPHCTSAQITTARDWSRPTSIAFMVCSATSARRYNKSPLLVTLPMRGDVSAITRPCHVAQECPRW